MNCQTCQHSLPTVCLGCDTGFSVSGDGSECFACALNCQVCNSTTCTTCNPGYVLNGGTNDCECLDLCTNCTTTAITNTCSDCVLDAFFLFVSCLACINGYYFDGTTCQDCLPECISCADNSSCIQCNAPFVLNLQKRCVCDASASQYRTTSNTTCDTCLNIISNCQSC